MVADVLKCFLNAIVAPRRILPGEAKNGIDDFLTGAWSTAFSLVAGVELLRDQFAMPPQNRVWCDNGGQFQQRLAANVMSLHGEQSTLIVIQQQSLLSELLEQCFDLCVLEFDDLLLSLVHHAAECSKQDVPGLEQEGHVRRRK